jgi:hypothetical protein
MLHQKQNEISTLRRIKLNTFFLRLSVRSVKFLVTIGIYFSFISSSEALKMINLMNNKPPINGKPQAITSVGINININAMNGNPQIQGSCLTVKNFLDNTKTWPYPPPYLTNVIADLSNCIVQGVTSSLYGGRGDFYSVDLFGYNNPTSFGSPLVSCPSIIKNIPIAKGPNEKKNQVENIRRLEAALSDHWAATLKADGTCTLATQ